MYSRCGDYPERKRPEGTRFYGRKDLESKIPSQWMAVNTSKSLIQPKQGEKTAVGMGIFFQYPFNNLGGSISEHLPVFAQNTPGELL